MERSFNRFLTDFERGRRAGLVRRVRANRRAKREACKQAHAKWKEAGSPGTFFQWLVDHADEIFAIILKLLVLFA